jgi:hypothetical protein
MERLAQVALFKPKAPGTTANLQRLWNSAPEWRRRIRSADNAGIRSYPVYSPGALAANKRGEHAKDSPQPTISLISFKARVWRASRRICWSGPLQWVCSNEVGRRWRTKARFGRGLAPSRHNSSPHDRGSGSFCVALVLRCARTAAAISSI